LLAKQKTACICSLFNDLQQETKLCGKSDVKIRCLFLLVDLNVSSVLVKLSLKEKVGLVIFSANFSRILYSGL